jgi:hypothetical protein
MIKMSPAEARARILAGTAPSDLHVDGSLYLTDCTRLTALPPGLHVDGLLYLHGCTGLTALPPDLYVGDLLDLYGCTGLTNIIRAGRDSRRHEFYGVRLANGWRVIAGCRNLSIQDARAHWGAGGKSDRPDCLALVEKIAAQLEDVR